MINNFFTDIYLEVRDWAQDTYYIGGQLTSELIFPSRTPYLQPIRPFCTGLGIAGVVAALAAVIIRASGVNFTLLALTSSLPLLGGFFGFPIFIYLSGPTFPLITISIIKIALTIIRGIFGS